MEVPLSKYDIWINGIRKDQSKERSKLSAFEKSKFNCLRYHILRLLIENNKKLSAC